MKFFIDTANIDEIKEAASYGFVDGVTTNPSLIAREKKSWKKVLPAICEVVPGPVSAEVVSVDSAEKMIAEGRELHKIADNIVVKIPLTMEGLKAVQVLEKEGIHTNVTLCFSASQALLVCKAGGSYVSPFLGRLDDISHEGMDLIAQSMAIINNYGYQTEIIAASIRSPMHVVEAALLGAHISTIPFKVINQLVKHPLTDIGMANFEKDWKAAGAEPII